MKNELIKGNLEGNANQETENAKTSKLVLRKTVIYDFPKVEGN